MSLERQLRSLANLPKPEVRPFWAARVTARATGVTPKPGSVSRGEMIYWLAVAVFAGPLLLTTWQRVVCLALVLLAVRVVAALSVGADMGVRPRRHTSL